MITYVPFKAEHVLRMTLQDSQAWMQLEPSELKPLECPAANTIMLDGQPIVCAGAVEYWPDRAYVWSLLSAEITPRIFPQIHSLTKQWLASLPYERIEAAVENGFYPGTRWLRALGFHCECWWMRKFQAGRDHSLWALIKEDAP